MIKTKPNTFYCFSPPVMLFTFIVEIILLVATYVRYKTSTVTRLAMAILLFLATFQLSEYFVCGGLGVNAAMWSRIGYIAITMLPALGIHLIQRIARLKTVAPVVFSYGLAAFWIVLFGFSETAFTGHQCAGNYVIFQLREGVGGWYFVYYYALLFMGIGVAVHKAGLIKDRATKEALYGMALGYLVFLVPTTVVNTLNPSTMLGIPSIMCGFAILYAFILAGFVVPRVAKLR